jgi:alpha-beta hydrolase superfamily lysophospholipase
MRHHLLPPVILLAVLILGAGCTGTGGGAGTPGSSWSVQNDGYLSLSCPFPTPVNEHVLEQNASLNLSEISFRNIDEEVYGLLAVPPNPRGAVILAPGAGISKEMEKGRVETYAMAGCAALVLDLRGNGGETQGHGFDPELDYLAFNAGTWPEFYKTACDLVVAQELVSGRWRGPVYAMGASNGGRYAAISAAADPGFAGYIGVSTSGFGLAGNEYSGNASRFLLSFDPDHAIGKISPRPVWIFHSRRDPIINFTQGEELFSHAGEPKEFIVFNGTHGENDEVDGKVIRICTAE